MTHRVIQWSTGNVGTYTLRATLNHPELDLVGLWVHSDEKVGRDAGSFCEAMTTGVLATQDSDALLALDADCVIYTATADTRPFEALDDICRILESGKNVVSSSIVGLVHPASMGDDVQKRLEEACRVGDVSVWTNGIDPGFANDVLPLVLTGLSETWTQIRVQEIVNYATYDQAEVVFGTMGFGQSMDETPLLLIPGMLSVGWGGTIRVLADGLGLALDEVIDRAESLPTPFDIATPMGTVPAGSRGAIRFEVVGIVDGEERLVVEHVTRMHDDVAPDWPQSDGGYRITIEGVPRISVHLEMEDEHGDHAVGGVILTATRLVNAIPAVIEAPSRPLTPLDLPTITGAGLMG